MRALTQAHVGTGIVLPSDFLAINIIAKKNIKITCLHSKMSKTHAYCFTWNNYTDDNIEALKSENFRYLIFGHEVAPTTGTPHLQGYIYYKNQRTVSAIIKKLKGIHLEASHGSPAQNHQYCSKDGKYEEYGTPPRQGTRSDIVEVRDAIKSSPSVRQMINDGHVSNLQCLKLAETLMKYYEQPRTEKPHVRWYYGATGTGKSKTAYEELPDAYTCMSTNRWFEGYDGHTQVIIDDMRKDFCKFHELLRILDRYPLRIECKNGSRQFLATQIIITSCHHPKQMFDTREDIKQLLRRIDEIRGFF